MKEKEINFGVIGGDRRGRISLKAHQPERGFRLIAASSLTPERLGFYRERCGESMLLTNDYRKLIESPSIDAIFVCSPDHLHEEHATAALEAGKHVFLEKPMAITIDGCDRLLEAARRSGKHLYVGHNMRFFPVMRKMKELVASGAVGEVQSIWCRHFISYGGDAYYRDWHSERKNTTSLLLQKGAHDLDIIHWLAGAYTQRIVGMGKLSVYDKLGRRSPHEPIPLVEFNTENWPPGQTTGYSPVIDVEDHSMLLLQLENGVQASYAQCHYTPDDHRNYTVIGTEGRLENYGDRSMPDHGAAIHLWNRRTGYSEKGHQIFQIPHQEGEHGGADPLLIEDFLAFLRNGVTRGSTLIDARMAVAAGYCGTASLRDGNRPKDIPPIPREKCT